jgi:G3E family GTPase
MTPVFVITGIHPPVTESVTVAMQFDLPNAVVAAYRIDPDTNQLVRTVSDISGHLETARVDLDHACTSCAIREDVIPTLHRLDNLDRWGAIIAQLPVGASALQVCRVCAMEAEDGAGLAVSGVIAALDGETVTADLTTEETLAERALPTFAGDDRGVAETLAGIIEYADAVRVRGAAETSGADLIDALRRPKSLVVSDWSQLPSSRLLGGIHAHVLAEKWVAEVRRHPVPTLNTEHVWSLDLRTDRPLDPDRFADSLEALCIGSHRIRGCVWLPSRHQTVCVLDGAAGQVRLGAHGRWHGRPLNRLTVVGLHDNTEPHAIAAAFADCTLTDHEVATRGTRWEVSRDGLEDWLGDINTPI